MKKILSSLLLFLLCAGMIFAGGAGESTASADGSYKIGVILYGREDTLGGRIYSLINDAAEALGCEVTFALGDYDPTAQITSAENLIASGVDGLIVLPLAETTSQRVSMLCRNNGVYFGLLLRTVQDETIAEEVRSNPYFVGNILGDDIGNANELSRILIEENGRTQLCMYYASEGTSMALRNEGIRQALDEYGAVQLAEAMIPTDGNTSPVASTVQNFVNTNAGIDGIISAAGSSGIGEAINSVLYSMPDKDVKYVCFDTFDGMIDAFEAGTLVAVCGGQATSAIYLFSMLYNAIDGHPLTETGQELLMPYMFLRSAEEAENFNNYIDNPEVAIYSDDEIRAMTVRHNPSFNWDELQNIMFDYTYENIISRMQI